jgi:hypothetical protein
MFDSDVSTSERSIFKVSILEEKYLIMTPFWLSCRAAFHGPTIYSLSNVGCGSMTWLLARTDGPHNTGPRKVPYEPSNYKRRSHYLRAQNVIAIKQVVTLLVPCLFLR